MNIENLFKKENYPFLSRQIDEFSQLEEQITVTNNTPLMPTVAIKLKPFIMNNIRLYVAADAEMHDKRVVEYLKEKNIFFSFNKDECALGDIFLDCGGDLLHKGHPKAIAELTQTGSEKYKKHEHSIPVISVDESKVKLLEDYFGTADGFIRAIKKKICPTLRNKHFIIWGYGKIGKGISRCLNLEHASATAIDIHKNENLNFARYQNVNLLHPDDVNEIKELVKHAYCLVTCTGVPNLISKLPYYQAILSSDLILANMGAEDEFGEKFPKKRVLNNKFAANFLLDFPTQLKYLDPVFYAHNLCVKLYIEGDLQKGFQKFPEKQAQAILDSWSEYWHEDISDIFKL